MEAHAPPSSRPYGIQNPVPYRVGHPVSETTLVPGGDRYLHVKLEEVRKWDPDWEYAAIGMEGDQGHLHMVIPPKYAVSFAVETLKKNTTRARSERFAFLKQVYWAGDGIWSTGDFISTGGANEAIIRRDRGDARPGRTPDKCSLNFDVRTPPVQVGYLWTKEN